MKLLTNQWNGNAKTKLTLALCTVLALTATSARAEDYKDKTAAEKDGVTPPSRTSTLSRSDQKFIQDAARGSMMEIHMGKLGVQKAQSESVKQFSQKLIDDHMKANVELRQLAATKGVTLPEPRDGGVTSTDSSISGIEGTGAPGANTGVTTDRSQVRDKSETDDSAHAEMKKLQSLSGTDFDKAFAKAAIKDHEKCVKEFEKTSEKADDTEVKAFAAKMLPTLREHLQTAKSLETQVKDAGAAARDAGTESGTSPDKVTIPAAK